MGVDSPFIRCYKALDYEREAGDIVTRNCDSSMSKMLPIREVLALSKPFDHSCFFRNLDRWKRECDLECRLQTQAQR